MFYIDEICLENKSAKILKPCALKEFQDKVELFFTTNEICIKTKEISEKEDVKANKERVLRHFNIDRENLYELGQTHSDNIFTVGNPDNPCCTRKDGANYLENTDGVILKGENKASIVNFADCTPVALFDPENTVVATLHAGWRGTALKIAQKGLKMMVKNFNSKPEKIIAIIGPNISQKGFQTGMEVYFELEKTIKNKDELFEFEGGKCYPDLAKINMRQLEEKGVKTFDISQFKTDLNNELLFSYRKNNGTTNRISMVTRLLA